MNSLKSIFGNYSTREIDRIMNIADSIEKLEESYKKLSDEELKNKTLDFKARIASGETLDKILPEAFATVREAAARVINLRHFKVQLLGGIILHQGRISEMKTGEGKTLVATLPSYLNALAGNGVHIVTTNDYLAKVQSEEMGKIHEFLGLTVGVILHDMTPEQRKEAYNADITYGTNNELGFDYLRDNLVQTKEERVQRGLNYAIVDEIDSILIDEARTPLIIAGEGNTASDIYYRADNIVKKLKEEEHYVIDMKVKAVTLTDAGIEFVEKEFGIENYGDRDNRLVQHHVVQALRANYIMIYNKDYIVKDDEVLIVDEFTGRVMEGRRFSEGLHEAIEAKEELEIKKESKTIATITLQNYFRTYSKLSGMTGTAFTEELEFREVYNLDVVVIPTNKPVIRVDHNDLVYKNTKSKYKAIVNEIIDTHAKGQPLLVGTSSIQKSEDISFLLKRKGIRHNVLNAKNHEREAKIVAAAGEKGAVTIATNMAGRGTDIKLGVGVAELGGLKVIGTDKHESRRIDNQLRGRSGRQGDPGSSIFIISLEDDLISHFVPESFKKLLDKLPSQENKPIESKSVTKAIEAAQKAVEGNHFSTRKNLVGYDDVINTQRKVIYSERNKVLDGEDVHEDILEMVKESLDKLVDDFTSSEDVEQDEIKNLLIFAEKLCIPEGILDVETLDELSTVELKNKLYETSVNFYKEKEAILGANFTRNLEKSILLNIVDDKWINHIDDLEFLKEGIGLRAYRQIEPVQAYILEASEMFEDMINSIKTDTISSIFNSLKRQNIEITS